MNNESCKEHLAKTADSAFDKKKARLMARKERLRDELFELMHQQRLCLKKMKTVNRKIRANYIDLSELEKKQSDGEQS